MKPSVKSVLFALGAAVLGAVMTLPASAQQSKPRGCDNVSTSRDKTPKPDSRCLLAVPDKYLDQQKHAVVKFISQNPPERTTKTPNGVIIYDGHDANGEPYRIVAGRNGWGTSGSAPQINAGSKTGGGSGGRTSAR